MRIFETLQRLARERPDQTAIRDSREALTWADLHDAVRAEALLLREAGLRPGDRVGIALPDGVDFVVLTLASLWAGLIVVPLGWRSPAPERASFRDHFGLDRIFIAPKSRAQPGETGWTRTATGSPRLDPSPRGPLEDCVMLLSSGTTGRPSAAVFSTSAWDQRVPTAVLHGDDARDARFLACTPLAFSAGVSFTLCHLAAGDPVVVHKPMSTAAELIESARESGTTHMLVVPVQLVALSDHAESLGTPDWAVRRINVTGAAISGEQLVRAARVLCPGIAETYGAAATAAATLLDVSVPAANLASVGRPVPGTEIRIVGAGGETLAVGETGVVEIRCPQLASRLIESDGAVTALAGGWYSPGDLGRFDSEGWLYIEGRVSDTIICGGANVYPDSVERALRRHPSVRDAAVVGRSAGPLGDEPVAFLVADAGTTHAMLAAHCRASLSAFQVPREFIFVDALPRTESGKVRRAELRARLALDRGAEP